MTERPAPDGSVAEVAVIGSSGFYSFLDDPEQLTVETPYGAPSRDLAYVVPGPTTRRTTSL